MSEPAYEKVSVTLPRALVDSARARAGTRGFSAYVAEGLRLAEHMAEVRQAWPDPHAAADAGKPTPRRRSSSTAKG